MGFQQLSTSPQSFPPHRRLKAFWHRERNFGDQLTQLLLARLGVKVDYAPAAEADVIGVGSILERVTAECHGAILGAGFMFSQTRREFPQARFVSVRGRLTAERCGLQGVLLGDLGLTVHRLFRKLPPVRRALAIVPHYVDRDHPLVIALRDQYPHDVAIIDVTAGPRSVLEEIAASEAVISSSLHGLIAAQALLKPASWVSLSNKVYGEGFKFRDHFSAMDMTCQPMEFSTPRSLSSILHELQPVSSQWQDRGDRLHQALVEWVKQLPTSEP